MEETNDVARFATNVLRGVAMRRVHKVNKEIDMPLELGTKRQRVLGLQEYQVSSALSF